MFPLQKRLLAFAVAAYKFANQYKSGDLRFSYARQLTRSASSIGANYAEACSSPSNKDFAAKIAIAKKEAQETIYWLELLIATSHSTNHSAILQESKEIIKILNSIHKKVQH